MSVLTSELNSRVKAVEKQDYSEESSKGTCFQSSKYPSLLPIIIEGLVDGVLILTEKGEWVHANEYARRICYQLSQEDTSQIEPLPQAIWRVCESLIDSRELFTDHQVIIESEISLANASTFRVRVRWLVLEDSAYPYLLVVIEDQNESRKNAAIVDSKKYGLTARETEVWLLYQAKHSYQEIADKLYITRNTVKKHMKNIYAKQQDILSAKPCKSKLV